MTTRPAAPRRHYWRPSAALRVAHNRGPRSRLAATVMAVIVAFTVTLTLAGPASASTSPDSETAVAAQTAPAAALVGAETPGIPPAVGVQASAGYDSTSGCCVAPNGVAGLGDDAFQFATRAEKLDHIFVPKHKLDPLVSQLGSREAVVQQMLTGVSGRTPAAGVFELTTNIAGQQVVVRGAVVDGVIKLGTAFTP